MKTKFHCPHCNVAIEAESSKAGMAGDCPACGQSLHIPVSPTQFKLGSYQGTCTIGAGKEPVVSRLTLLVIRQENQIIHGNLKTTGELEVDSEFTGTATGDQIQFVTITPDKKLTVEWLAVIQGDSFRGTFSATDTGFWASVFGREHQHGEWQCTKERFPIIRRLKSFAKRVLAVVLVGVLALLILGASAIFNSASTSSTAYSPSSPPSTTPLYQDAQVPSTTAYPSSPQSSYYSPQLQSQPIERRYTPRVSPEDLAKMGRLSSQIFFPPQKNSVHVRGHWRSGTWVKPHVRKPPGGF